MDGGSPHSVRINATLGLTATGSDGLGADFGELIFALEDGANARLEMSVGRPAGFPT